MKKSAFKLIAVLGLFAGMLLAGALNAMYNPSNVQHLAIWPAPIDHPRRIVERTLLLPDGKVSCVSCHQGYRKEHGKLVVTKEKSALCFECRNL